MHGKGPLKDTSYNNTDKKEEVGIQVSNEKKEQEQVVLINVFTAKPSKLEELIAFQSKAMHSLTDNDDIPGWIGARWHRSIHDNKAVMMITFENIQFANNWLKNLNSSEHVDKIKHLVEKTEGGYYTLVKKVGTMDI
ncbi:antibiotic biosynthesis monooxygenase family protein [Shimazuella alba]|uniref:ABM domain-containing protein n=1 Tax=Shimazuella alba TaxID=2690964 RepID=A0A6I4VPJ1_9BACL|nr:hypothetical protein [Shimazuella alba]MXQ53479.1 hypothetical protein [Shimazuella alba]